MCSCNKGKPAPTGFAKTSTTSAQDAQRAGAAAAARQAATAPHGTVVRPS